jgi:hypothetical protein
MPLGVAAAPMSSSGVLLASASASALPKGGTSQGTGAMGASVRAGSAGRQALVALRKRRSVDPPTAAGAGLGGGAPPQEASTSLMADGPMQQQQALATADYPSATAPFGPELIGRPLWFGEVRTSVNL